MSNIDKIKAEIERLQLCTMDEHMNFYSERAEGEYNALSNIEYFIDALSEETSEVWHKGNEEPKDKSKAVVCQLGDETQTVLTMEYHAEDKMFHILSPLGTDYTTPLDYPNIRWAYPEDLLPTK